MENEKTICDTCPYAQQINQLVNDSERNSKDHKEFYEKFNDLNVSSAVTNERYDTIIRNINSLTAKVESIASIPASRWNYAVLAVLGALIGGVVTAVITKLF